MTENDKLQMFEDKPIRTAWDEEREEWYFSIVDAVAVLTEQTDPRKASTYWAVMKNRLKDEGADELLTNCKQLKMRSPKDGKRYKTDVGEGVVTVPLFNVLDQTGYVVIIIIFN